MSEVAERQELVEAPAQEGALEVFKTAKGLDPFLKTVRRQVDAFLAEPPDLETRAGRQAYASMAHKVARSKTAVDAVGKELVAELKQLPKTVDAHRKQWRDTLDGWRDEVRGPLNEWEAAEEARQARLQERIDNIKAFEEVEGLQAAGIAVQIDNLEAIEIDESWQEYEAEAHRAKSRVIDSLKATLERQRAREAEQAELARLRAEQEAREQQEREERIAREAEERARQEARQEAERREREHQEALAKAQREAEERATQERRQREQEEQQRQAEARRQQEEQQRRQADKDHRASVNRTALQALVDSGMPDDCARQAITLIVRGQVPHVSMNY